MDNASNHRPSQSLFSILYSDLSLVEMDARKGSACEWVRCVLIVPFYVILRILLKQDTALLSHIRVCVS